MMANSSNTPFTQNNKSNSEKPPLPPNPDASVFDDLVSSGLEKVKAAHCGELKAQARLLPTMPIFRPATDFDSITDLFELGWELFHSYIDLDCPEIQARIQRAAGTLHGSVLRERIWPTPEPIKSKPQRRPRPTVPSAPSLPSLFDDLNI
jgi:hypothetical protein